MADRVFDLDDLARINKVLLQTFSMDRIRKWGADWADSCKMSTFA